MAETSAASTLRAVTPRSPVTVLSTPGGIGVLLELLKLKPKDTAVMASLMAVEAPDESPLAFGVDRWLWLGAHGALQVQQGAADAGTAMPASPMGLDPRQSRRRQSLTFGSSS